MHNPTPRLSHKKPAYIDGYSLKNKPTDNDAINAEGTGNAYKTQMSVNSNPDDPLNREFTLDVIKTSTRIPPPTGQDLVNRNTLIRQEYKEMRNKYGLLVFFNIFCFDVRLTFKDEPS